MHQLFAVFTLSLLASGAVAGSWKVSDGGKDCLLMDMNLTFAVDYTTADDKSQVATFDLPSDATVDAASACGQTASNIKLHFYDSYTLNLTFGVKGASYELEKLEFFYESDATRFPNVKVPGQSHNVANDAIKFITPVGKSYRCNSDDKDTSLNGVALTFSDVKLQPFGVMDGKFSEESVCADDQATTLAPTTTPAATTPKTTPVGPTTVAPNATTVAPNATTAMTTLVTILTSLDNATTAIVTTMEPATTAPPKPTEGNWTVSDGNKTCMNMAFNANFSISYIDAKNKTQVMKFKLPINADASTSTCSQNTSMFVLQFNTTWKMAMMFEKTTNSKYGKSKGTFNAFQMTQFNLSYVDPLSRDGKAYTNTSYFLTNLKKTYMCDANQVVKADNVNVTFSDVKLQPFANGSKYPGDLEDCKMDDKSSNIVPIAVGCALAGLVVIVLIAYLIGRKRTKSVGYQTV